MGSKIGKRNILERETSQKKCDAEENELSYKSSTKSIHENDLCPQDKNNPDADMELNLQINQKGDKLVELHIPHVRQNYDWDCGLACLKMILQFFNITFNDFDSVYESLNCETRVWTIDLCIILSHYEIPCKYYTITLGVDQNYSKERYYRTNYNKDTHRVNSQFHNAQTLGIVVEKRSLKLDEIITHLLCSHLIIILVNWNLMDCNWCCKNKCLHSSSSCIGKLPLGYQGHFIVLCGCDYDKRLVFYKNPSFKEELCCCSWKILEQGRKSYGTDEDVIFINKPPESIDITHAM